MLKPRPLVFEDRNYKSYVENVYISSLCNADKKSARLQLNMVDNVEVAPDDGTRVPIQERILAAKGLISASRPGSAPVSRVKSRQSSDRAPSARSCDRNGVDKTTNQSYRFRKGRPGSCCAK